MARCRNPFLYTPKFLDDGRPNFGNWTKQIACQKCPECMKRKVSAWHFRLMNELQHSITADFITLTYDEKHVPFTEKGLHTLQKQHVQSYMKRLRKAHDDLIRKIRKETKVKDIPYIRLKYFCVGEYGTETERPHYHIILFNAKLDLIHASWKNTETNKLLGDCYYGTVTGASIGYVLKYMSKPSNIGQLQGRQSEFRLMSNGIGLKYISQDIVKWHKADPVNRMYIQIEGGKKIAMPRYIKEKLYTEKKVVWQKGTYHKASSTAIRGKYVHIRDSSQLKQIASKLTAKMQEELLKKELRMTLTDKYNEVQAHAYQFKKMRKDAILNRKKI